MVPSKALSYSMRDAPSELRFGRYEVLFRIAAGGMAEVYAARMVGEGGFEKPVALKRMLPTLAEDERFVQMFLDEGRLAAHISSPHVVQTLDLGRAEDDSLYLVMELVVGVSLSALIRALLRKKQQLPVNVVLDIVAQAAEGLHDAHEARTMYGQPLEIVHRDVSPQNILVDVSGRVRITDFGVARALERATHTQSGEVKGKIGYFAPEQVKGKQVDRRTDVFALGIVAWETLAGRRLFAGDNPAQTLDFVMSMPVPRLDAIRADVPRALADAVAHALERDLDQRTPTAGDFAEELRRALRPAGAAAVSAIVREHGGESLMKLEEGLRAQSPSSLSRVRKAQQGGSPSSSGGQAAPRLYEPAQLTGELDSTRQLGNPDHAPTRPELPAAVGPGQAPTAILLAPEARPVPMSAPAPVPAPVQASSSGSTGLGAPDPFSSPVPLPLDDEPAPRNRVWIVGAAAAAIGLLAAVGLGALAMMDQTPPEPTTVALPPVAAPAAPPAAVVAPTAVTTPATATTQSPTTVATTPTEATPSTVTRPRAGGAGRRERELRPATPEPTPPRVEEETPRVATTTRPREPEPPPTTTGRTTSGGSSGTSMRTGLVGLGEFEDEIGQ